MIKKTKEKKDMTNGKTIQKIKVYFLGVLIYSEENILD